MSAWVPITRAVLASAIEAYTSFFFRRGVPPVSSSTETPSGSSRVNVLKCCKASTSVGAITAACSPLPIANRQAAMATTVLPEPTSPWSRRFMGTARSMSARISPVALTWSPVSAKGSADMKARCGAPSTVLPADPAVSRRRLRESARKYCMKKSSL